MGFYDKIFTCVFVRVFVNSNVNQWNHWDSIQAPLSHVFHLFYRNHVSGIRYVKHSKLLFCWFCTVFIFISYNVGENWNDLSIGKKGTPIVWMWIPKEEDQRHIELYIYLYTFQYRNMCIYYFLFLYDCSERNYFV